MGFSWIAKVDWRQLGIIISDLSGRLQSTKLERYKWVIMYPLSATNSALGISLGATQAGRRHGCIAVLLFPIVVGISMQCQGECKVFCVTV